MKQLIGLTVCFALALALSGCGGKSEPKSTASSPSPPVSRPSTPPTPSQAPAPTPDPADAAAKAKVAAKPKVDPSDDHSDDPWYGGDVAATGGNDLFGMALGALGIKTPPGAATSTGSASPGEKKPNAAAASWEPDKALVEELDPYQDIEGYQIRPPKGRPRIDLPTPSGVKVVGWGGLPRPDGTAAMFVVTIVTPPPGEAKPPSADAILGATLADLKAHHKDWQQTAVERGQVNGLAVLRTTWQGTAVPGDRKTRGFAYFGQDGTTFVLIRSQDAEPHLEQTLKVAETAARTFRKK